MFPLEPFWDLPVEIITSPEFSARAFPEVINRAPLIFAPRPVDIFTFPDEVLLVRCSASDLPEALDHAFKLEEFSISLAPAGLRSFIHHFHPAYSAPLEELVAPSGGD